ncbi:MAG: type IV secretory system conjugative DNA transfer family protein, partial [Nitrospira sp.]|nr:type IV secretory system conjugative DNA transfer family protein [Nitrospira sp.]
MHNSVKSSFSRPAAQRKIGWRAWNRYLIGILFAALWFWLISIPAIIQQSETFENWPERLVVLSPADLEALPKGTFDNSSRAIEEFSKTLNSGRLCFKWEPGCDETQMNKPPTFAQTTSYLGPSHWQALRFVCINLFLLIVLFWALIHNNYGLIRAPFWLKDSYLVPISLVVGLGCAWFYVYSYWGRDHPVGSSEDFRAVLAIAPPILLTALPAWVMAGQEYIKEHPLYRQLFVLGRGGASRFGGIYSFTRYDFQDWPIGALERHAPIYAGETPWSDDPRIGGRAIGLDSDSMMLTVAAMGGGKSLYAAWNNLLTWPGGAFILDPKGEHAQRCHQARSRNQSTAVHIIDPWGEVPHLGSSACFNPLDSIDLFHSNALDD